MRYKNLIQCLRILRKMGPKNVIITSAAISGEKKLTCFSLSGDSDDIFEYSFEKLDFCFVGTGDSCTALLLASTNIYPNLNVNIINIDRCKRNYGCNEKSSSKHYG